MLASVSFLALWGAVLIDVHLTDDRFVRQGPKWCWMVFVALLPIFGAAAWMLFGRPFFMVRRDPVAVEPIVGHEDTPEWEAFVADFSAAEQTKRLD